MGTVGSSVLFMNIMTLVVFGIMIYGLCYIIGGPRAADGFTRGVDRNARRGVRGVGRGAGRMAMRYPLVAGTIVLVLVLSRC